jgi:hypothetical protein
MRAKRWISVLAVLGVLVHAAAIVRHSTGLTSAAFQYLTLRADLGLLCHSAATANVAADAGLPGIPPPKDGQDCCQVCCSPGSAVALLAPDSASLFIPSVEAVSVGTAQYGAPQPSHAACPPARGPPAFA